MIYISDFKIVPSFLSSNFNLTNKSLSYGNPRGTLQQPNICALSASSSDNDKPVAKVFFTLLCVNCLFSCASFKAFSSLALSIKAAISLVFINSSFSNSEDCLICGLISSGFCFFYYFFFFFFIIWKWDSIWFLFGFR